MDREKAESLTRTHVLLIGTSVFILGAFGYSAFLGLGLERASAGIAAEAVLVLLVLAWTSTYLLRVINGRMTYMEQRKRYRNIYDKLSAVQLQKQFDALTPEQQQEVLRSISSDI